MSAPAVSVLIVSYESYATLGWCLEALRRQTRDDYEVVLADNGSTDGAARAEASADRSIVFLENRRNLGFAEANNRAAGVAKGRWLALLNPDAYPEPDWLERLLAAAERRPDVRCFASLQLDDADPERLDGAGDVMTAAGVGYRGGYRAPRSATPAEGEVFAACGAAMLIDRRLFLELGGFDPDFFCYCEDLDLGWRLQLRGEPVLFVPDAVVRHVGGASSGERSAFALWHGARNRLWTFVKNTPPLLFALTAPLHAAATLALVVAALVRLEFATVRGVAAGFGGLPRVWRARGAVQRNRSASSLQVARALLWNPFAALRRAPHVRSTRPSESRGAVSART